MSKRQQNFHTERKPIQKFEVRVWLTKEAIEKLKEISAAHPEIEFGLSSNDMGVYFVSCDKEVDAFPGLYYFISDYLEVEEGSIRSVNIIDQLREENSTYIEGVYTSEFDANMGKVTVKYKVDFDASIITVESKTLMDAEKLYSLFRQEKLKRTESWTSDIEEDESDENSAENELNAFDENNGKDEAESYYRDDDYDEDDED